MHTLPRTLRARSHDITVLLIQNGPSVDASLPAKFNMVS